jgi:hypothetical protein
MSFRKRLAVGAAAATLGLVLGATVFSPVIATAQESTTTTPTDPADQARPDRGARIRESLEALVTDGTITAAQADAVAEHLASVGPGPGHFGGRGGGIGLDAAAEVIGIEPSVLVAALRDGQSIADVATANGVTPQAVIDALVAAHQARLDEKVADGSITADEAATRAANAVERITAMVNGEFELRPGSMGRPGNRPFNGPFTGLGNGSGEEAATATDEGA